MSIDLLNAAREALNALNSQANHGGGIPSHVRENLRAAILALGHAHDAHLKDDCIPKGAMVRVRTTNGGEVLAKLVHEYVPTFAVTLEVTHGASFSVPPDRIRSIEPA